MRIIFAVHTYYPAHNGVQAITQYMAEGLAKLHHEIMVISEKRMDLWNRKNIMGYQYIE